MRKMDIQPVEGHKFEFTRNWFLNRNLPTFRRFVHPEWAGKSVTYLEIGVWEGMSLVWMMQHVLTHPDSKAVGVDPWLITTKVTEGAMNLVKVRAWNNLTPWIDRCTLQCGNSAEVLRRMVKRHGFLGIKRESVDLCMVDGNHNALGVWDDCRLVYQLLKPGGWMMLDDVENDKPKVDHVKEGLALWLSEQPMKQVWKHRYMECYEKSSL